MGKRVIGILAHVDAGKTTLTESLLYVSGAIRKQGRVDQKDTTLDYNEMERDRGITIFSKQTKLTWKDEEIILLDTPGHADFSPETERTLDVLDAAVLIISGPEGVQSQTRIWNRLLKKRGIPTIVFVNKMDRVMEGGPDVFPQIEELGDEFVDTGLPEAEYKERLALLDEALLEAFLETGNLPEGAEQNLFLSRKAVPCYFGSARNNEGTKELLDLLSGLPGVIGGAKSGALVYKIGRDMQGERLTYVKVTGGSLHVKDAIDTGDAQSEKINQIRIYTSQKYETVQEVEAGGICALTGLKNTRPGQGLGAQEDVKSASLEPVMRYELVADEQIDPKSLSEAARQLAEEEPTLAPQTEKNGAISLHFMGEIQKQVVQKQFADRFGIAVSFGMPHISYKETIASSAEGVGHFEPLRHYAEVHLLLEPLKSGEGLVITSDLPVDVLAANWQKQVLSTLKHEILCGVLTGSPITDMKISLVNGKAHVKHTEGGDFREATLRALRQGLMKAQNVLLEPWLEIHAQLPSGYAGRIMKDIQDRGGEIQPPLLDEERAYFTGTLPASNLGDYEAELRSYTGGSGSMSLSFAGYHPADLSHAEDAVRGYIPQEDLARPAGSVFCVHGAGTYIEWDEVENYMHLPLLKDRDKQEQVVIKTPQVQRKAATAEELDKIFAGAHQSANKKSKARGRDRLANQQEKAKPKIRQNAEIRIKEKPKLPQILLVDGYNIIFAWEELKTLADENMDASRLMLQDILCNYQGITGQEIIVVYDAYRVADHDTEVLRYRNIHIVFTKTAETADQYIEKAAIALKGKKETIVATSDGIEQVIVFAQGAKILSAMRLKEEVDHMNRWIREHHLEQQIQEPNYLFDHMDEGLRKSLEEMRIGDRAYESGDKIGKNHE